MLLKHLRHSSSTPRLWPPSGFPPLRGRPWFHPAKEEDPSNQILRPGRERRAPVEANKTHCGLMDPVRAGSFQIMASKSCGSGFFLTAHTTTRLMSAREVRDSHASPSVESEKDGSKKQGNRSSNSEPFPLPSTCNNTDLNVGWSMPGWCLWSEKLQGSCVLYAPVV